MTQCNGGPRLDSGNNWKTGLENKFPQLRAWPGRTNEMNVYEKLNAARAKFHSLKLTKSGENKFAGYKYFELGDFLIPGMQCLSEQGLCAYISFEDKATMTIVDTTKPDERIVILSPMSEANLKGCHPVQNLGAVQTYLRRYLWVAALEIVEHDALDAVTGSKNGEPEKRVIPASFRSSPTMGAMDALDDQARAYVEDLCDRVNQLGSANRWREAVELIEGEQLDDELKTALWSLLDSKTRSAIKKAQQAMKEAA